MKRSYKRLPKTKKGSVRLQSGEFIITSQQRKLRSLVRKANYMRNKMIEKLPQKAKTKYVEFGVESDFIYRKKSTRLNKFRNKTEFKKYIRSLERITSGKYQKYITKIYRSNYNRALSNTLNSEADEIINILNTLSDDEFMELTLNEELENIGYVYYEPISKQNKIEKLNKQILAIRG